ncbi:MAG: type II toxin-antitoxin system RelE/ParE family toxin [Bdellovibrionales bacterium]|nr:type II toxin-antitoxin system RelE/ParE family toxin [Bdellovibrionales bacterium]
MKLEFHPEAILEAREARQWYAERNPAAAEAFMNELDLGIERIVDRPELRAIHMLGTRRYLFQYFPFAIVYRVKDDVIQVVAIAHGRRKPGYWKERL